MVLTDAFPLAVLSIRRIVDLRVREFPAELLIEREEGHLAALESLPGSMRATIGAAGRDEGCPSRTREDVREHSHCTVDVIVGDPVLPLVRRNCDEWAAAHNTADLYSMAEQQKRQQRSATGGERDSGALRSRYTYIEYHSFEVRRSHGCTWTRTVLVIYTQQPLEKPRG